MVTDVSSNPIGGNFILCWNFSNTSMSILYRNLRFVLRMKNLIDWETWPRCIYFYSGISSHYSQSYAQVTICYLCPSFYLHWKHYLLLGKVTNFVEKLQPFLGLELRIVFIHTKSIWHGGYSAISCYGLGCWIMELMR